MKLIHKNLRSRLRKEKIRVLFPYKCETKSYCLSARCLIARRGVPWDIIEQELKQEGWLDPHENILEVLKDPKNLKRKLNREDDVLDWGIPEDFTEEDYINYMEDLKRWMD